MAAKDQIIYARDYTASTVRDYLEFFGKFLDDEEREVLKNYSFKTRPRCFTEEQCSCYDRARARLEGIESIPDIERIGKSKDFILRVKNFSEQYQVTTEILRKPTMISARLYFGAEVLDGEKCKGFLDLMKIADEVTFITEPEGEYAWHRIAVVMNYWTHHCFNKGHNLLEG